MLKDCKALISTVGKRKHEPLVASTATQHILDVMREYNTDRYVSVAGINVDMPFDKKSEQTESATQYMKTNFPQIQDDRRKAYTMLHQAEVAWTLTRVPMIEFSEDVQDLKISLDDCLGTKITAGSKARFIGQQLFNDTFIRKAPFIANS